MNRIRKSTLHQVFFVFVLFLASMLTSCYNSNIDGGDVNNEHHHSFSDEWSFDEYTHWHKAICEHGYETTDFEVHQYVNGVCSICGYENYENVLINGVNYSLSSEESAYIVTGLGYNCESYTDLVIQSYVNNKPVIRIKENEVD